MLFFLKSGIINLIVEESFSIRVHNIMNKRRLCFMAVKKPAKKTVKKPAAKKK